MDATWIVFETKPTGTRAKLWAWCLHRGGSEFSEVRLTERDGMTVAAPVASDDVAEINGEGEPIRLVLERLVCVLPASDVDVAGGAGDPLGDLIARDSAVGVIRDVLARLEPGRHAEVLEMAQS